MIQNLPTRAMMAAGDAPDAERIQGTWRVTGGVFQGLPVPLKELRESNTKYVIGKGTFALVEGDPPRTTLADKYRIDATKSPKTLDLLDSKTGEVVAVGIYRLKGDRLEMCWFHGKDEQKRPSEFKAQIGRSVTFVVTERVRSR